MWIFYNGNFSLREKTYFPFNLIDNIQRTVFQRFFVCQKKIFFAEASYFNLMATMRKSGLKIPLEFTEDYFTKIIEKLVEINNYESGKAEVTVIKSINNQTINLIVNFFPQENGSFYRAKKIRADVFKELTVLSDFLKIQPIIHPENTVAERYCIENELDDVIILNNNKKICRTLLGNLYGLREDNIIAIETKDGSYRQAIDFEFQKFLLQHNSYKFTTETISPFETQQMEDIFIAVEGEGFYSIKNIRQKEFSTEKTQKLIADFQNFCFN